jgi:hypothetical protein
MPLSRRELLLAASTLSAPLRAQPLLAQPASRRKALVQRHNPTLSSFNPQSPLSVGNGEFAFTADITGLQTYPGRYEKACPLCTQSQWGWHSFPNPNGFDLQNFRMTDNGYPVDSKGQKEAYDWLRENPHRLNLARIGLRLPPEEPANIRQTLDLWTGVLTSHFEIAGRPVRVETCVHPTLDALAVTVDSPLRPGIGFELPYGSAGINASDWTQPAAHQSALTRTANGFELLRTLDADRCTIAGHWESPGNAPAQLTQTKAHEFVLQPSADRIGFVLYFGSTSPQTLPTAAATFDACRAHWPKFWESGIGFELSNPEIERRAVLSQYLTAIQSAGSLPPQETGLTCNSWYGKFHLEMYWWHTAHFALWGRPELLARSFSYYERILPQAQATAKRQGYQGARWPKMTGFEGRESPSNVGPWLIWNQPHPIEIAELLYKSNPTQATLERYAPIVFESAVFMASFCKFDQANARYVLGPGLIPAQENHPPHETWNPTFELEYWHHALGIAQEWRRRLKLAPNPKWDDIRARLSPLPVKDGVYLAHENCPQTYTERNRDHPSMLMALGYLPGDRADKETMRRTYKKVLDTWKFDDTWGWDYGMMAMTAARLGDRQLALEALLRDTPKNRSLPNGHTPQRANLPVYLPSNGALLSALALMAG